MMDEEESKKIKEHLLAQLVNFPEDQKKSIKEKIISMTEEELIIFLKENDLDLQKGKNEPQKCVFCSIVNKQIKSHIIDENDEFLSILEINPLSRGHSLVVPKKHVSINELSESSLKFAKETALIISEKLKPTDIKFQKNEILGHAFLEIIPSNDGEEQKKHLVEEAELIKLLDILKSKEKMVKTNSSENAKETEKKTILPKIKPRLNWI